MNKTQQWQTTSFFMISLGEQTYDFGQANPWSEYQSNRREGLQKPSKTSFGDSPEASF